MDRIRIARRLVRIAEMISGDGDELMEVTTRCPMCGKTNVLSVSKKSYDAWRKGKLIQQAFPEMSPEERELLKTGICDECWDDMFGNE